jgi:hypothetical protein
VGWGWTGRMRQEQIQRLYYDVLMSVVSLYFNGCIPEISVK